MLNVTPDVGFETHNRYIVGSLIMFNLLDAFEHAWHPFV